MRNDREKLLDILEAIEKIEERTRNDKYAFEHDEMIQVWVLYHIQVIGEAAGRLSETLRNKYPNVPWSNIVAMRNVIVHHYFGVDLDQIWDTVTNDLPALKAWTTEIFNDVCPGVLSGAQGSQVVTLQTAKEDQEFFKRFPVLRKHDYRTSVIFPVLSSSSKTTTPPSRCL